MIVIADTSGLLAAVDPEEVDHLACVVALSEASLVVISPLVLAELDYLVSTGFGEMAAVTVLDGIAQSARQGIHAIASLTSEDVVDASHVRRAYSALNLGLTDAVNVVLADRFATTTLVTLDRRHFSAVRPLSLSEAFTLLPDDQPA